MHSARHHPHPSAVPSSITLERPRGLAAGWLPRLSHLLFGAIGFVVAACGATQHSSEGESDPIRNEHLQDAGKDAAVVVIDPTPPYVPSADTALVLGLQADDLVPTFGISLHEVSLRARVDGALTLERTLAASSFPVEVRLVAPEGKTGAAVSVELEGRIDDPYAAEEADRVVIHRRASTTFVAGQTKLLRLSLDERCVEQVPPRPGGFPPPLGPRCEGTTTCSLGRCIASEVPSASLAAYDPAWTTTPLPDPCVGEGAPEVVAGRGETTFEPLDDVVTLEAGPQGGYHMWLGIQTKNLKRAGTVTKMRGRWLDSGTTFPETWVQTPLVPGEDGRCGFTRIQFVVDSFAAGLCAKRGKAFELVLEVAEKNGRSASTTRQLRVPDTLPLSFGQDPCAP